MSGIHDRQGFEDWDSIFEDSEPTRVITPESVQHARNPGDHTRPLKRYADQQGTMSATRDNQLAQSVELGQAHTIPDQLPLSQQGNASLQAGNISAYRRVQFIPAGSGALVAYGLSTGLFALVRTTFDALGVSTYSNFTGAVMAVFTASSQSQALPWTVASALIWLFSFGCAGYTASRMSVVAPTKQAIGVLAVTCFGVFLATLVTWMTVSLPSPITPPFALQPLLDPDLAIGFLTALAAGLLTIIGSMLGAWSGIRYHQRLTGNNL